MVDGVESKPIRVFLPSCADELLGCEALESFEAFGEVVGHQESLEMFLQVLMGLVIKLLDSGFFQGPGSCARPARWSRDG